MKKLILLLSIALSTSPILHTEAENVNVRDQIISAIWRADKKMFERAIALKKHTEEDLKIAEKTILINWFIRFGIITWSGMVFCFKALPQLYSSLSTFQKQKKALPSLTTKVMRELLFQNNHPLLRATFRSFCASTATAVLSGGLFIAGFKQFISLVDILGQLAVARGQLILENAKKSTDATLAKSGHLPSTAT